MTCNHRLDLGAGVSAGLVSGTPDLDPVFGEVPQHAGVHREDLGEPA